ncbi:MAG: BREX-6 system adenine-specific DNA-methyltransferase PglX [Deltaproteobacteria bacterium]|nr:BREX-6 system adenine-specific DNA-methyltransferase PglX [Deltaproteobacteria bacterium]
MTTTLTPDAKQQLSTTIRALRERLLRDVHDEADRRYRLSVPIANAGLDAASLHLRQRLDAWLDERARAAKTRSKKDEATTRERLLRDAEKEAAATFLNRIVLLRHLEALKLSRPEVVTGGWKSKGYKEFREFAPTLTTDDTEGYATLLQLVFDELSFDLPGLFGDVGLTRLFAIPPATLREVIERLDDEGLASAWTDDTTLGWVYQYWNDPERESLDAKIAGGGKIEPHEIASKTQMFTERYMVEWLLQNSLGLLWLSICRKNGWTAEAESVLPALDARRAEWRKRREAGEVALDALMPIEAGLEDRWKYFVLQPIPADSVEKAPKSIRDLKLLDPACGSGHFLVIAFDLLAALYDEEDRHLGRVRTPPKQVAEAILENNLFGIDIDPRATQLAAAGLYLKAKTLARDARPKRLNLVAPVLQLASLPKDDPALVQLRKELREEVGISEALTDRIVTALEGVDHLGSLLKVDAAVEDAITAADLEVEKKTGQGDLFRGYEAQQMKVPVAQARTSALDGIEKFLATHSVSGDLGLRLDGEQLAAGMRFVRMARAGTYDLVVGNPPYQGTSKLANAAYVAKHYPRGKADLYAAFLERGLELVRPGGISALLTMRGWMFLGQFAELRKGLLHATRPSLGDLGWGAFEHMTDNPVTMSVLVCSSSGGSSVAICPADPTARVRTDTHRHALVAGMLAQVGRYEFDPRGFEVIEGEPIVYWWSREFLSEYATTPKLGQSQTVRYGLSTQDNVRWLRRPWEVRRADVMLKSFGEKSGWDGRPWVTYIKGSEGRTWCDEVRDVVLWRAKGLELATYPENRFGRGTTWYYERGVAFANIGATFSARAHTRQSIFGHVAGSVFCRDVAEIVCLLNSERARTTMESLNPGIHFLTTDVERLPLLQIACAKEIFDRVEGVFFAHESGREASVEFRRPGRSAWTYAQDWAQRAVDRPEGAPLPPFEPVYEPAPPEAFDSFAVGVALGRFGAKGEGILDHSPDSALAAGILFLTPEGPDSLDHPACTQLIDAWKEHGVAVGKGDDLRTYLRKSFFAYHKKLYENRPIYFPLSSAKKSFVAFISIHRWKDDTLQLLLADHLVPERRRLEGELEDLRKARAAGSSKAKAEKRFAESQKLLEELSDFIDKVTVVADQGPPPPDDKTPKREVDAKYVMDLDDGVMVNSSALWTLLEPQWKDPKKGWKELATAQGRKDYDWSHLAARYFPKRVEAKCHEDPSLGVAHKCFWRLHPAKAYAWELRLQDEIKPDFTIDEPGSDEYRGKFLAEHPRDAEEIRAKEQARRERKARKASEDDEPNDGPLFEDAEESADED